MRNTVAKRLRRKVYGDLSRRGTTYTGMKRRRMTPLRYEIMAMLRKHPDEQGYIIARALDTTPGYVSKVRKEAGDD